MKILVTSDLHLSSRIWNHRPIDGDSYHSWHQIVNLAHEHNVNAVILAGDILDKQINVSDPIHELLAGVASLTEKGIAVYYNQGQHEYQSSPWLQAAAKAVWLHENPSVYLDGWQITGCDYQNSEEKLKQFLESELARECPILVCHQVWKDFMGDMAKPQGCFKDIPQNVKYLITGDYHQHLVHHYGDLTVLSPGSTHMRSISEPEEKSVFLLSTHNKKHVFNLQPMVESLPLRTRRCIRVHADKAKGSWDVLQLYTEAMLERAEAYAKKHALPEELTIPLVQLVHASNDIELVGRFKQHFSTRAHLFFKQKEEQKLETEERIVQNLSGDRVSMLQCVDACVNKSDKPLVHNLVLTLLQSSDPEQALQQWIKSQV